MNKKILNTCIAATLLGLASVSAQAATIELKQVNNVLNLGDSVMFEIWADFSDVGGTIGGGLDVFYDTTILSYNNDFAFDPNFGADLTISRTGDDCSVDPTVSGCASANEINGISPNNFSGMADVLSLMGTLSFTGIGVGLTDLTMADNDLPAGGWFDNTTFDPVFPAYNTAMAEVVVPVPAAAWLMLSGLGLLGGLARRKVNA